MLLGHQSIDWNLIKQRVETLWEEFQLPIWITEFDWNGEGEIDWGDHSQHADIVEDFYRLMFSLEVSKPQVKCLWKSQRPTYITSQFTESLLGG